MIVKLPITAIIMTYNEQLNLPECLESIDSYIDEIIIIDSYSKDGTVDIASRHTGKIYKNKFINQSDQFVWAMNHADIKHEWILRIDADERWTEKGFDELRTIIENDKADGVYVKMKIFFMGKWIRHGGVYPNYFLRVFKRSKGTMEDRWMDEHIQVNGKTLISNIDVIELNYDRQKNISGWTAKHNDYSTREAIDFLLTMHYSQKTNLIADPFGNKTERKRWIKQNIYFKLPLFARPFLYFIYRYIFQLGFLDGKEGFVFHILQAFWYRFLVDVKIYQIGQTAKKEKKNIKEIIEENHI